eukprot:SAG22_NODE_19762_length_272_cov_0.283237_1_plen_35_part_10
MEGGKKETRSQGLTHGAHLFVADHGLPEVDFLVYH